MRQKLEFKCLLEVTTTSIHNKTVKIMQKHASHTNPHMMLFEACSYLLQLQCKRCWREMTELGKSWTRTNKKSTLAFFKQKCLFFRGNTKFWRKLAAPKLPKFSFLPFFLQVQISLRFTTRFSEDNRSLTEFLTGCSNLESWAEESQYIILRASRVIIRCRMVDNSIIIKLNKINMY